MVETKVRVFTAIVVKVEAWRLPCLSPVRQVHLKQRLFSYRPAKYNCNHFDALEYSASSMFSYH